MMRPSSYCIPVKMGKKDTTILFHGYSGAVDMVRNNVLHLLSNPDRELSPVNGNVSTDTIAMLKKRGYLTDKSPEEERKFVRELGERVHRINRKYTPAGFLIIPTYSCNLRCPYCYEQKLRKNGRAWLNKCMGQQTADDAFAAMEQINTVPTKQKSLSFYGGEPLQKKTRDVVEYIFRKAREKGYRIFSAITNGVDLQYFLDLLGPEEKIRFLQITLDGPPEIHNQRRALANGAGTFLRITENISKALKTGVTVSVRVNVDHRNITGINTLRDFFTTKGWHQYANFRAYCSPVHNSIDACNGPPSEHLQGHLDMQKAIKIQKQTMGDKLDICALTSSISKRILAHLQNKGLPRWKTGFCGSNIGMYMLDAHGDIYPCWEVIGHKKHKIGTFGRNAVSLDSSKADKWHNRSVVRIEECLDCPYLFFCGGGCEAFALQKTGALDRPNCSDFPVFFHKAAVKAYNQFTRATSTCMPSSENVARS